MNFKYCIDQVIDHIGIDSLGHTSFSLITVILKKSQENQWSDTLVLENDEMKLLSGIRCDATLWRSRNRLQLYKLIKYDTNDKPGHPGTYQILFENLGISKKMLEQMQKSVSVEKTCLQSIS